jgi:4-hydroxy-2-oxoheptanedioate aldolase
VQIETRLGLDNLEAIARVEGVDGVFIGPGDLSAGLGYLGDQGNPEFRSIVEDAMRRIKACGKAPGILTGDEALARRCIELGCLFTAVGADSGILARGSEQLAAKFKG